MFPGPRALSLVPVRIEDEREDDRLDRRLDAPKRLVESLGGVVVSFSQHPRLAASQVPTEAEQRPQQFLSEAPTPVPGGNPDFIDPELRVLVRVNVVHRRGEAHDVTLVQRNGQMMPSVLEELADEVTSHRKVEDLW